MSLNGLEIKVYCNRKKINESFNNYEPDLHVFFGVGANPRAYGKITLLTSVSNANLAFSPQTIQFKAGIIGCRVNRYSTYGNQKVVIQSTDFQQHLFPGYVYTFSSDSNFYPTPSAWEDKQLLERQVFVLNNQQNGDLWYALMKLIRFNKYDDYTPHIYSVFTIPSNSSLEIQPQSFVILHYSLDPLQKGEIKTSIVAGQNPAKIMLTQQCQEASVTYSTEEHQWRFQETNQPCRLENLKTIKPLSKYCITDITQGETPSYPDQNPINLTIPVNFQDTQGRYICGSYKGTWTLPRQYPILGANCTKPTSFKLEPGSLNQKYLKDGITINLKTENKDDLTDRSGTFHPEWSLLGYWSGYFFDSITKLCCYYYSADGDHTRWLIVPKTDSYTFNEYIKNGSQVYLKNQATEQYLAPKPLDGQIYLTVNAQPYPWIITTALRT